MNVLITGANGTVGSDLVNFFSEKNKVYAFYRTPNSASKNLKSKNIIWIKQDLRKKIALFCNVKIDSVIESIDVDTIYDVPLKMMEEGLDTITIKKLGLKSKEPNLDKWKNFLHKLRRISLVRRLAGKPPYVPKEENPTYFKLHGRNEMKNILKEISNTICILFKHTYLLKY